MLNGCRCIVAVKLDVERSVIFNRDQYVIGRFRLIIEGTGCQENCDENSDNDKDRNDFDRGLKLLLLFLFSEFFF